MPYCPRCRRHKASGHYNKDAARSNGLQGFCKACHKAYRLYEDRPALEIEVSVNTEFPSRASVQYDRRQGLDQMVEDCAVVVVVTPSGARYEWRSLE